MGIIAIIVEVVGILMISVGVIIELFYGAHFGFIIITVGAALIAAGGLIWAKILPWRRHSRG